MPAAPQADADTAVPPTMIDVPMYSDLANAPPPELMNAPPLLDDDASVVLLIVIVPVVTRSPPNESDMA